MLVPKEEPSVLYHLLHALSFKPLQKDFSKVFKVTVSLSRTLGPTFAATGGAKPNTQRKAQYRKTGSYVASEFSWDE